MDCREAQAVISALHDGEQVSDEELAGAQAHCPSCSECTAFRDALARLDASPSPASPPELTERIMAAVDAAAVQDATAAAGLAPGADAAPAPSAAALPAWMPVWLTRKRLWAGTGAIVAAAAVISAMALVSTGALQMFGSSGQGASTRGPAIPPPDLTKKSVPESVPGTDYSAAVPTAPTPVAYISFDGRVYRPGPTLETPASNLTTIGAASSAFDKPGTPVQVTVYRSALSDGSIVVRTPSGLQQYTAVVRSLTGKTYQLTTGAPIARFGEWPTLPPQYPQPTQPDGTPTFRQSGADAMGVAAYSPPGSTSESGFAIAPGSSSNDPAGGNPNWTWWTPLVVP